MDGSGRGTGGAGSGGDKEQPGRGAGMGDQSGLAGLGLQFVIAILLCLFVGRWLDTRLGTTPWLMILGMFAGAGASTVAMYRKIFPPEPRGQGADKKHSK